MRAAQGPRLGREPDSQRLVLEAESHIFGNDSGIGISMFNSVAEVHHHVPELSQKVTAASEPLHTGKKA
jgi:hypothetical protein